jgi:hypothetical protein
MPAGEADAGPPLGATGATVKGVPRPARLRTGQAARRGRAGELTPCRGGVREGLGVCQHAGGVGQPCKVAPLGSSPSSRARVQNVRMASGVAARPACAAMASRPQLLPIGIGSVACCGVAEQGGEPQCAAGCVGDAP